MPRSGQAERRRQARQGRRERAHGAYGLNVLPRNGEVPRVLRLDAVIAAGDALALGPIAG
jgi:hypothetical protein